MRYSIIKALIQKDLREVLQNKAFTLPSIFVPLIFSIFLPLGFLLLFRFMPEAQMNSMSPQELAQLMKMVPPALQSSLQNLSPDRMGLVLMLGYLMAPMFLVFPIMFSTIIAADSFAGERERKTIEALFYTSASDEELFLGKALAAFIPAILITWFSFAIYTLILNTAGYYIYERVWFPLTSWYPIIFWITPAVAAIGTMFTVLVSAKTATFMGAYQTSGVLVLIVLGLMGGQLSGLLYLNFTVGLIVGLVFWLIAWLLSRFAVKKFNRKSLIQSS